MLISATPFVATGHGLLYGRLDVEVVRQRIRLARLPKAFEGFHIVQLSDVHIGPFTSADYIRHCVTITNGLKPDLIVLTGDYIAWIRRLKWRRFVLCEARGVACFVIAFPSTRAVWPVAAIKEERS